MKDIVQLKIVLKGTKPPVWRRVLVDVDTNFYELHCVVQQAMGWEMAHMYEFHYDNYRIGEVDEYYEDMGFGTGDLIDAVNLTLKDVIAAGKKKINYEYDFGDGWEHVITIEKILERDATINYPICTKAKLACPPEDCGGVGGFYYFLDVLEDKKHPEHQEYLEWYGSFDKNEVDLKLINQCLLPISDFINERKGVKKKLDENLLEKKAELLELITSFCTQKLDEEYLAICSNVLAKMSNKAKVPFQRGKLEIWAASIIYAIGSINFLFDKASNQFNISAQDISSFFGTKNSTVSNKARIIKEMFDITTFDEEFSVQSMKDSNPFNELVLVDELLVPIASLPEELQQKVREARSKGEDIQFFTK